MRRIPSTYLMSAVAVAVTIAVPLCMPINIATEIMIFGIFALATYLLISVAGLYSFGQAELFGVGGYVAGYVLIHQELPLIAGLVVEAVGSELVDLGVGVVG